MDMLNNLLYSPIFENFILWVGGVTATALIFLKTKAISWIKGVLQGSNNDNSSEFNRALEYIKQYRDERDYWYKEYERIRENFVKVRNEHLEKDNVIQEITKKHLELTQRVKLLEKLIVKQSKQLEAANNIIRNWQQNSNYKN